MKNFEQKSKEEKVSNDSEKIDEIALRASEMAEFQNAVTQSKSKMGAIKVVRELLRNHFPEISEIPKPIRKEGIDSNEFMIAKNIVNLLYWE